MVGPDGQPVAPQPGAPIVGMQPPRTLAPATAPAAPTPFKAAGERAESEEGAAKGPAGEGDFDDDDMENSLSFAAIEAELKPRCWRPSATSPAPIRAAPAAGPGHPVPAQEPVALARAGAQVQEAQGRDHRRREAVSRSLADQSRTIRVPVHMIEIINKIVRTSHQMLNEMGREPTPEELAEKLRMPLEKVARLSRSPRSRSRSKRRSATRRIHTSATSSRTRTRSFRSTQRSN